MTAVVGFAVCSSTTAQSWTLSVEEHLSSEEGDSLNTYRVYFSANSENDQLSAVFGNEDFPLSITTTEGFYNHPMVSGPTAGTVLPALLAFFPDIIRDSWVTIGISEAPVGNQSAVSTVQSSSQPWTEHFMFGGTLDGQDVLVDTPSGGMWFVLSSSINGFPDATTLKVLLMQITSSDPPSGQINIQIFPDGDNSAAELLSFVFTGVGTFQSVNLEDVPGCTNPNACNYDASATISDGSCYFPASGLDCENNCLADTDGDGVCDPFEIWGCDSEEACNYNASATENDGSCEFPPIGLDCTGQCLNDADGDGVCDAHEIVGCLDPAGCNFLPTATDNGACVYPQFGYDCAGNCLMDTDSDGICDLFEVLGCMDPEACNFDESATDPGSCHWPETGFDCIGNCTEDLDGDGVCDPLELHGCTQHDACNYNPEATEEDGSCVHPTGTVNCAGECTLGSDAFGNCIAPCENALSWEVVADHDTSGISALAGYVTYRLFLATEHPNDWVSSFYGDEGNPLWLLSESGFWQHDLGGDFAPDIQPDLLATDAALAYDSWLTLNELPGGTDPLIITATGMDLALESFNSGGPLILDAASGSSWQHAVDPADPLADNDQRILIAQLTTSSSVEVLINADVVTGAELPGVIAQQGLDCTIGAACNDTTACNYLPWATNSLQCFYPDFGYGCDGACIGDEDGDGICDALEIAGCDDPSACNFTPGSTDPAACEYQIPGYSCDLDCLEDDDLDGICNEFEIPGCMDTSACNFSELATDDDGGCEYASCIGCMDSAACNFNPGATVSGECTFPVPLFDCEGNCLADDDGDGICNENEPAGCMDVGACNYVPSAEFDDGSCFFPNVCDQCPGFEWSSANGASYLNDFSDCSLNDLSFIGQPPSVSSIAFSDSCGLLLTHYAGQETPIVWPSDQSFRFGTYSVMARTNSGIADANLKLFRTDAGSLEISIRPEETDNPGISISGFGLDYNQDFSNVTIGTWFSIEVVAAYNLIELYVNNELIYRNTDSGQPFMTPPAGQFALSVAHRFRFDDWSFTPAVSPSECPIEGCTDGNACNYSSAANYDDGNCTYPLEGYDCNGACLNDFDGDGNCDEQPPAGCESLHWMCIADHDTTGIEELSGYKTYRYALALEEGQALHALFGDTIHPWRVVSQGTIYQAPDGGALAPMLSAQGDGLYDSWWAAGWPVSAALNPLPLDLDESLANWESGGEWEILNGESLIALNGPTDWVMVGQITTDGPHYIELGYQTFFNDTSLESHAVACGPNHGGCTDPLACNFSDIAAVDDSSCNYPDPGYLCDGSCDGDVDGDGVCDENEIAGCTDPLACNFAINPTDLEACTFPQVGYDCNGNCNADADGDGICDEFEIAGCSVPSACNYEPLLTDLEPCTYAAPGFDCNGVCLDDDGDGVCNFDEVPGCTDGTACNFEPTATEADGSCSYPDPGEDCSGLCLSDSNGDGICEVFGCTDPSACNYNESANEDDGTCVHCTCSGIYTPIPYLLIENHLAESMEGLNTYRIYVSLPQPTDFLRLVFGNDDHPLTLLAENGFYNHPLASGATADGLLPAFFSFFPALEYDSWVTIGLENGGLEAGQQAVNLMEDLAHPWTPHFKPNLPESGTSLDIAAGDGGAWGVLPGATNGLPNATTGLILIAQLTADVPPSGQINVQVHPEGTSALAYDLTFAFDGLGAFFDPFSGSYCGCTDPGAVNFLPGASHDDGTCEFIEGGCIDDEACNYNPALEDDVDDCVFPDAGYDCSGLCLLDSDGDGICDGFEIPGCAQQAACNFQPEATDDDGSCEWPEFGYTCLGACSEDADGDGICDPFEVPGCLNPSACNFVPNATDEIACTWPEFGYDCEGNCLDSNENGVCDVDDPCFVGCMDETACNFEPFATVDSGNCQFVDECGVCGGNGWPWGGCDCEGTPPQPGYDCFGMCIIDSDGDGICDAFEVAGCTDPVACNYNEAATDLAECTFPPVHQDCEGNCLLDSDGDGICDEDELPGCLDPDALNFVSYATESSNCLYPEDVIPECPRDLSGDGFINVEDLLILLSGYGTSCP